MDTKLVHVKILISYLSWSINKKKAIKKVYRPGVVFWICLRNTGTSYAIDPSGSTKTIKLLSN